MPADMTHSGLPTRPGLPTRRFDPFRQLGGLTFYPRPEFPALNLWTGPEGAVVALEVPGVSAEALDITIRRDTITVHGNRPAEQTDDRTVVLRQERMTGAFTRTIVLPFGVDADKCTAKFEHGVVTLTLPRPENDKPKHIKVARS